MLRGCQNLQEEEDHIILARYLGHAFPYKAKSEYWWHPTYGMNPFYSAANPRISNQPLSHERSSPQGYSVAIRAS